MAWTYPRKRRVREVTIKGRSLRMATCAMCGEWFKVKQAGAITCSPACRDAAMRLCSRKGTGALLGCLLLAGVARAQAPDLRVQPCYEVTVAAVGTDPVTELCLATDATPPVQILCAPPDASGQARLKLCQPGVPRFVRGVARNAFGDSPASPNRAELRSRADCNGDWTVNVSDFLCTNSIIFGGP